MFRYWEQLTEAETAAMLGCCDGTVKAAASRGLRRMRELSGPGLTSDGELAEKENGWGCGDIRFPVAPAV